MVRYFMKLRKHVHGLLFLPYFLDCWFEPHERIIYVIDCGRTLTFQWGMLLWQRMEGANQFDSFKIDSSFSVSFSTTASVQFNIYRLGLCVPVLYKVYLITDLFEGTNRYCGYQHGTIHRKVWKEIIIQLHSELFEGVSNLRRKWIAGVKWIYGVP